MFDLDNIREVVDSLHRKTELQQLRWDLDTKEEAFVPLPLVLDAHRKSVNCIVSAFRCHTPASVFRLRHFDVAEGPDAAVLSVLRPTDDKTLGDWAVSEGDPDWPRILGLYMCIRSQFPPDVVRDVLHGIEGEAADVEESDEQSFSFEESTRQFFASVAGSWVLWYYRGSTRRVERLRIDEEGNYYIIKRGDRPYFRLRDVFYDPDGRSVSFAKEEATGPREGRIRQVEVLRVSPDGMRMTGYAQHDGHRLEYARVVE